MMTTDQNLTTAANRYSYISLAVGLVGLAVGVIGAFTGSLERFFQAYLVAFIFWLGLSLGSLAFLMIHFLTGSRWGLTVRRVNEAAASTLWLMAGLFIPLLFNLKRLYLWARPEVVQANPVLQMKSVYLNVPFFTGRAVFYFATWILLAFIINRLSARWVKSGEPAVKERLQGLGAFGLIVYTVTMSFASIDWLMSLQPFWSSTAYGLIIIFGQLLSSLSFAILILNVVPGLGLGRNWNLRTTPIPFKDLGALLLTFVMSWAYVAYFQFLIIWAGNIPGEVSWYLDRIQGGWLTVAILVAVLLFVLPFVVLISMKVRNNLRLLAWLGALIVLVSFVNVYWLVIPAFHPGQFSLSWLDILLPIGMGGLWIADFLFTLKMRPALREAEQTSLIPETGHESAVS
ncbi:MAG: hypothetical protein IT308_06885 [Anaerolineaceae bacterium]|nr:hypothetical protein [Anaerolineaceae bacterium]